MELKQMPNKYQGLEKAEVAAWLENPVTRRAMEVVSRRTSDLRESIIASVMSKSMESAVLNGDCLAEIAYVESIIFGEARRHVG